MTAPAGRSDSSPAPPSLIGRDRELDALRDAFDAAFAGHGSLVLIGGEAGVGKTSLAEAICVEAAARGALVLVGRCYDLSETPPYGPWREAFARAPRAGDLPILPAAVLPTTGAGEALTSQEAIFSRVHAYVEAAGARAPLAILLDDLHWADPASLDLLRTLARSVTDLPLLLLATYRSDELTRRHPLYALLPLLVREARATRLDLHPLDDDGLRALVRVHHTLSPADESRLVAYLRDRAEGNLFYSGELLRTLEEERTLRPGAELAQLGDLSAVRLPSFLRQVIDARVARLGEEAGRRLAVAAVLGHEVPYALWAAIGAESEEALLALVERAAEAHLLEETPDGTAVRFGHALIREALYEGLPPSRRRVLHRWAGEALAATSTSGEPDPDAVAYHFQRAGDERAAEWLIRAGERAQRAYTWLMAAERYEAAVALLEGRGHSARQRALLLMTLAQLRRYVDAAQGVAYLEEAGRLVEEAGDADLAAAAAFDRGHLRQMAPSFEQNYDSRAAESGDNRVLGLAEMRAALPTLEAMPHDALRQLPALVVLNIAPGEPYHRGVLVRWLAQTGHLVEAQAYAAPLADPAAVPTARGLAGQGILAATLGQPEVARRAFAAGAAVFRAAGQHFEAATARGHELLYCVLRYQADDLAERQRLADAVADGYRRAGGVNDLVSALRERGMLLFMEGGWAELRRAVTLIGERRLGVIVEIGAGPLAREQGDRDYAWAQVQRFLPEGPATAPGAGTLLLMQHYQRLGAQLALDERDLPAARAWLEAHDRWLAWSGAVLGRSEGQLAWAEYYRAAGDPAQARDRADRGLAHASDPRQPLALLAARRFLGELDTAEGRHDDAATHLATALALAIACAAPYERALTLLALVELDHSSGDLDDARARLAEARAILESLEARPALARAAALESRLTASAGPAPTPTYPAGLSAREAEVLQLVAQGLSNAQAAERLFLSPRTVDQHLRSIYGKLGVENRAAATRFAIEHGLA